MLCDMACSLSPSVSCIRPSASPKLAQRWPYTLHPITHLCAGKGTQQLQSQCETHPPTNPPSANNGFSHLLFWRVSGRTYHQILAHFNYCTHFILQIIVGCTCLLVEDLISVFSPLPTGRMGSLQIPLWQLPVESLQSSSRYNLFLFCYDRVGLHFFGL